MKTPRLGLISLSGVRVRDEVLLREGMTLPGFVERSEVIASLPSLGLLTLASHTPSHWEIEYLDINDLTDQALARMLGSGFDIIAISALSARIFEAYSLADTLRENNITVILGGLHVSALPYEAALHADAVVVGEGEAVWPQLIADFEVQRLQSQYSSFSQPFQFCHSRTPRYDLLDISKYNRLTLQTTRGCPLDCAFCAASKTISRWKTKPLDHVRRDLEAILKIWPRPFLELADDNSFADKKYARELVRLLGEYNVPWFTESDISLADDDELLELLALANCAQVLVGLESANYKSLKDIDRANWKARRADKTLVAIEKIQSHGVSVNGCFVLGLDEDDEHVFEATRNWVRASNLSEVQITLLTPFPGTRLYHQLSHQKRLLQPIFWERCTLFDINYLPAHLSAQELHSGFTWLMRELYNPVETAKRKAHFKACRKARRTFTAHATLS